MYNPLGIILQISPPPPDGWGDPDVPNTPIDSHTWILIFAMIILAFLKLYYKKSTYK